MLRPWFTAAYNVLGILLAALGWLPPIFAAAAQALPDGAVMLNSSRSYVNRLGSREAIEVAPPMRRSDVAAVVLAMGLGASSIAAAGTPDGGSRSRCGEWRVDVIDATPAEAGDICVALSDVVRYFRTLRFRVAPRLSVMVRSRPAADASRHARLHGFFDARGQQIVVFRAPDATPWRLAWDGDIAASFVRHEFVHMAIVRSLRTEHVRLRPEWHEFIAYAVQIALMDDTLRDRVLAAYPDVEAVADLTAVNEFTYRMDPDRFAITAYRTYLALGGPRFIDALLRFQIVPPPLSYPFPMWTPGQDLQPETGAGRERSR